MNSNNCHPEPEQRVRPAWETPGQCQAPSVRLSPLLTRPHPLAGAGGNTGSPHTRTETSGSCMHSHTLQFYPFKADMTYLYMIYLYI